ncbi:MAG TPA: ABC transporter permease, partial [Gemmataceae bacterium]|nr:ABC transporter permease [Gemmataceae bacterium]
MNLFALLEEIGHFAYFSYKSLLVLPGSLLQPRETMGQFYRILIGALPLAVVAGLAIGLVLWMHLRGVLVRTGGPGTIQYLPTAVALAVVLEFAPIGAGLIVAGRTGASLGAELGAMRLTEQIDALEAMGQSSLRRLIGPRVLACMVALPLLTIFIATLAILGAFGAEMLTGSITSLQYEMNTWNGLRMEDVLPSTLKTLFFGFVTGVSGCYFGMKAHGGTEGVGHAATR